MSVKKKNIKLQIVGLVMSWLVTVSELCIKTSNIGHKIIKIVAVRFLCVLK
jgi:hypothetical protein